MAGTEQKDPNPDRRQHISAKDARGADIVLRTRWMRIIFIAGLVGFVLFAIIWRL